MTNLERIEQLEAQVAELANSIEFLGCLIRSVTSLSNIDGLKVLDLAIKMDKEFKEEETKQ